MRFLTALFLLPLALAACSKNDATTANIAAAAPVAGATAPAGQKWQDVVTKTEQGYRMGNPDAPVKLVEYGARLCPGCAQFAATGFQPLIDDYVSTGKVSFEFRDFLIHGPAELALATLGQCGGTGPFFPILEQTYANQQSFVDKWQAMTPAQQQTAGKSPGQIMTDYATAMGAIDFVKQRGIPEDKARACLKDEKTLNDITAVTEKAGGDGTVTSTPTVIVDGKPVENPTWDNVSQALKAAGA
ncbi:MAG: thioredoxin domain-containing protein [Sphingomonas bacterium]|nr:thioredoxin domain-containing protein [Sphingomonas bacterium]